MIRNVMLKLNNGVEMPAIGLGTFQATKDSILLGIEAGYRHIDIAPVYGNEAEVGEAIKESKVSRNQLFLSVKIWNDDMRKGNIREALTRSLKNLNTDYIDLLLFHWPVKEKYIETWLKMEGLYREGLAKAIGVSNCTVRQLEEIRKSGTIIPAVDQIEIHPQFIQQDVVDYCKKTGVIIQTWSPLGRGKYTNDPILAEIGKKYGKSAAQIVLRWNLQRGCCVIPKASTEKRLYENADIFDFELSEEDMNKINEMDTGIRSDSDPENFDF